DSPPSWVFVVCLLFSWLLLAFGRRAQGHRLGAELADLLLVVLDLLGGRVGLDELLVELAGVVHEELPLGRLLLLGLVLLVLRHLDRAADHLADLGRAAERPLVVVAGAAARGLGEDRAAEVELERVAELVAVERRRALRLLDRGVAEAERSARERVRVL